MSKCLLIDTRTTNYNVISNSTNSSTTCILYDYESDTITSIEEKISQISKPFTKIAIVTHNSETNDYFRLVKAQSQCL